MSPLAKFREQSMKRHSLPHSTSSESAAPAPSADGAAASRPKGNELSASEILEQIQQALANLKFGHVTITVQDGVVVQIERIEKRRLR